MVEKKDFIVDTKERTSESRLNWGIGGGVGRKRRERGKRGDQEPRAEDQEKA